MSAGDLKLSGSTPNPPEAGHGERTAVSLSDPGGRPPGGCDNT
jgi:hypothetical protein